MIFLLKIHIQSSVTEAEFDIPKRKMTQTRERIHKKNNNFLRIMEQVSTTTKIIHSTDQEMSTI